MEELPSDLAWDPQRLAERAAEIVASGRELAALGWAPATSGNFSMRLDEKHAAITVSGRDKGRLSAGDVMVVDLDGKPVGTAHRPSAETPLHAQLYARRSEVGAVLHTHSRTQTVASRLFAAQGHVRLEGYELLKAFAGVTTHDARVDVPIVANGQDMQAFVARVAPLIEDPARWGYLIDGHGLYAWGRDMPEARRHLEAFEMLLACELDLRRLT